MMWIDHDRRGGRVMSTQERGPGRPPEVPEDGSRGRPSAQNTGKQAGEDVLAHALAKVARALQTESGLKAPLRAVVVAAVDTIPGADFGGITEVRKSHQEIDVRYAS